MTGFKIRKMCWVNILKKVVLGAALFLLAFFCWSCQPSSDTSGKAREYEITKEYKRGPVKFAVKISKKEISIAERIELVLEVRSREGYQVKLPDFGEKLEQFGIVDYHAPAPKLIGDKLVSSSKVYTLEPFLSGEYKIPPMTVLFWKKGEEKQHQLESEELSVQVTSLLPEDFKDLVIKDISPPVGLPGSGKGWLYGSLAVVILLGAGIIAYFIYRRSGKEEVEERELPHEIAYTALAGLLAEELIEQGKIKKFYLRLSNILRHYIENRFGLQAPERTTEEFLADLRNTKVLNSVHKELLKNFLEHCDLVKFAAFHPENKEIQEAFDACKRFIMETEIKTISPQGSSSEGGAG